MKSVSSRQQARYGTVTVAVRLGCYDVLAYSAQDGADQMAVVMPVKPERPRKLAKELRAIARQLDGEEDVRPAEEP